MTRVTVVVPVYNAGTALEPGVQSLLGQTMPSSEFEVIYVDDGSTDGSGARVDELAAAHENISAYHIPNSGWPGRPRNIGIDHARGRYVQFMDQDDALGSEALDRLYEYAERTDADIVIGKVASNFRRVYHEMFREDLERQTILSYPLLIRSLTPHKFFRLSMLNEHGLRFPEGPRRLEDQPFVTAAYFAAKSIGVLSSYVCYYYQRREDGQNTAARPFSPKGYYNNLREVIDVVEANTEPGEFRDLLLRRFYQAEMVNRLGRRGYIDEEPSEFFLEAWEEIRELAIERFGPGVAAGIPAAMRVRSSYLLANDLDGIQTFAEHFVAIKADAVLQRAEWVDGKLQLCVTATLQDEGTGTPLMFDQVDDRLLLSATQFGLEALPAEVRDATDDVAECTAELIMRERETNAEYYLPGEWHHTLEPVEGTAVTPRVTSTATLDPRTVMFGAPLPAGLWDVSIRIKVAGWGKRPRVGATRSPEAEVSSVAVLVRPDAPAVLMHWTKDFGNLTVIVDPPKKFVAERVAEVGEFTLTKEGSRPRLALTLPLVGEQPLTGSFELDRIGPTPLALQLPFSVRDVPGGSEVYVDLPGRHRVRSSGLSLGMWRVRVNVDDVDISGLNRVRNVLRVPATGPIELCPPDVDASNPPVPLVRRVRRLVS